MTQVTLATPVAFPTVGLPDQQRIELWESHNADTLIGLRCRSVTAAVREATETNIQLERLHLARVRGSAHVVERDHDLIRRRPAEATALFFGLAGEAFFYHDDGVRSLQPGQMLMCDADRPFKPGFSQGLGGARPQAATRRLRRHDRPGRGRAARRLPKATSMTVAEVGPRTAHLGRGQACAA
jgi:AraC-binding-like domain